MTDIVYRMQALIPATQDMESTSVAETIEEGCGEIFNLRGALKQARKERDEARADLSSWKKYAREQEMYAHEARAALEAAEELYLKASPDAWKNGVTDPSGMSDEGEYMAAQVYDQIRSIIAKLKDRTP